MPGDTVDMGFGTPMEGTMPRKRKFVSIVLKFSSALKAAWFADALSLVARTGYWPKGLTITRGSANPKLVTLTGPTVEW